MQLDGRAVLLTGATGGLGHSIARALAARGARLTLSGRRAELLDPLAAELGAVALAADLAQREGVRRLIDSAGEVDVLVANAGLPGSGDLLEYEPEQIERAIDVNLRAPMLLARAFAPAMVARGEGHVVLMSSIAGKFASAHASVYHATKFGLRGFGLGLRADLHGTGVGVSVILPAAIADAGMFAETGLKPHPLVSERRPEHVAKAVVKAIERDVAEIDVAAFRERLGAAFAGIAPELAAAVQRRLGGDRFAEQIAQAQRAKR